MSPQGGVEAESYDILVSGGGVAGLVAAAVFGAEGWRVLCVDPSPPVTDAGAEGADLRSTAFLQPARALLAQCGLWDRLDAHAAPLRVMRIVDAGGEAGVARDVVDFDSADLSEQPFGWNLPNWLLRREMVAHLATLPGVTFRSGVGFARMLARLDAAHVWLSDGTRLRARLVVAADGRDSPVRAALGIGASTTRYGQKALAFTVTHPVPHDNISTEIHREGGPFTLVPLPDLDGQPHSAVVWMERGPRALALRNMAVPEFEVALNERACGLLGPLTLVSARNLWPIITRHAEALTGPRTALVAEAAHVMPPIGAQGLNMSLRDLACLRDLVRGAPDPGDTALLDAYARARMPDIRFRLAGIDLLNRAALEGAPVWRDLRRAGLKAFHGITPVRRTLMQLGLGARG